MPGQTSTRLSATSGRRSTVPPSVDRLQSKQIHGSPAGYVFVAPAQRETVYPIKGRAAALPNSRPPRKFLAAESSGDWYVGNPASWTGSTARFRHEPAGTSRPDRRKHALRVPGDSPARNPGPGRASPHETAGRSRPDRWKDAIRVPAPRLSRNPGRRSVPAAAFDERFTIQRRHTLSSTTAVVVP
jgi:hypothetical protein